MNIITDVFIINYQLSISFFGYQLKLPPAKYLIRAEIGEIPDAAEV